MTATTPLGLLEPDPPPSQLPNTTPSVRSTPPAYRFEPELTSRTPRRVRFKAKTQRARLVMVNALTAVVLACFWLASRDIRELHALQTSGVTRNAEVYKEYESHDDDEANYYLRYRYSADAGEIITGRIRVPESRYNQTQIGDTLPITFLRADPTHHRVGQVDASRVARQNRNWWIIVALVTLLFGGIFALCERWRRRNLRLLRDGVPVAAKVTRLRAINNETLAYYVTYAFSLTSVLVYAKEVSVPPALYMRLAEGDTITVLYDPENPERNRPYDHIPDAELG